MPKAKKPPQPVAPTPPPKLVGAAPPPKPIDLPIIYPNVEAIEYSTTSKKGPLTIADQKQLMGWETEKEYQKRKVAEVPTSKPEHWVFGDIFHCKNVAGEKVRCNYNANNRPFDMTWCESLIHTVLHGQWAGPATVPGETINGETIRVSKYGRVLSGQHQMTGCILADEFLEKARRELGMPAADAKYPMWGLTTGKHNHPFLETLVVLGMSEDPRVLMTVDYVKPRTAADVFYTSEVFKSSTPPERKELCRMLSVAVDLLWNRTGARGYKTHPEIVAFLERHKNLMRFVLHLYESNYSGDKKSITSLRLSPGQCSAMCYLMATSGKVDDEAYGEAYRNEAPAPSEKSLNWAMLDKAEEFWTYLASGDDFKIVREALGRLMDSNVNNDDNMGLGGRGPEKLAIIARAWEIWKNHKSDRTVPFHANDLAPDGRLCLSYSDLDDKGNKLPDGQIKLLDLADFGGIDCPEVKAGGKVVEVDPPTPTPEEIEKAKAEAIKRRQLAVK